MIKELTNVWNKTYDASINTKDATIEVVEGYVSPFLFIRTKERSFGFSPEGYLFHTTPGSSALQNTRKVSPENKELIQKAVNLY